MTVFPHTYKNFKQEILSKSCITVDFLYISQGQRAETGACPEIVQGMLRIRGFQTPDDGSWPPSPTTATIVTPSSLKTASELMNIFLSWGGGGVVFKQLGWGGGELVFKQEVCNRQFFTKGQLCPKLIICIFSVLVSMQKLQRAPDSTRLGGNFCRQMADIRCPFHSVTSYGRGITSQRSQLWHSCYFTA